MYTDNVYINIEAHFMALQIANPAVVDKIERLAMLTGLNKTAAVEIAVDSLLLEAERSSVRERRTGRIEALLKQFDRIPDRADAHDPLEWDAHGLPK